MSLLNSLIAWIAKHFTESKTMTDTNDGAPAAEMTVNDLQATLAPAAAPALLDAGSASPASEPVDLLGLAAVAVKLVDPAAAPAVDAVLALDAMIPAGTITKLETILGALGHELPAFWAEAVALAKKA
ncbi:hypothetical protein HK44_020585 [Pseudomonas fluorescens HK44]|uniref:Uncharacterized protein n=1 Tax=Pseudomonas fluorescens HK44 TaxID=1042209 RepID=A0A010SU62_PSEFL|nr:hypothetical protein [Pseudomonas fluorescens]EXF96285.1 hypothetical protein HK44_020585 [Pseudomonas fluorescens HK44]